MLTVNEALDALNELAGKPVVITGLLRFEFEHVAIEHAPVSEQRARDQRDGWPSGSSIWLSVGWGSLAFNEDVLTRWNGKMVRVAGTLYGPDPGMGGCGHFSGWPAQIVASQIERVESEEP